MSLLPSAMRDSDPIPTGLGKKIERSEEKKKEVDLGNGIYSVDGKLETRRPMPDLPVPDIVPDGLQMPFKVYLFTSNGKPLETRIEKNEEANQPTTLEQAWSFMHGFRVGQVVRHRMLGGGRSGVVVYVDEAKAEARVQWDFGFMCTSIFQELEVL